MGVKRGEAHIGESGDMPSGGRVFRHALCVLGAPTCVALGSKGKLDLPVSETDEARRS